MGTEATKIIEKKHYWGWLSFALKWFWIIIWAYFLVLQFQTTESIFAPNMQFFSLEQMNIDSLWNNIPYYGIILGLIIEALYLTAAMALNRILMNAAKSHIYHVKIVGAIITFGVIANVITDAMYGPCWYPPVPILGHALYAIVAEAIIIYSPIFSNAV